jgi:hypothetical protein
VIRLSKAFHIVPLVCSSFGCGTASDDVRLGTSTPTTNAPTATTTNTTPTTSKATTAPEETSESTPTPIPAPHASSALYIYGYSMAASSYIIYLGCATCSESLAESVFNPTGIYGTKLSTTSINNQSSSWGSPASEVSACNTAAVNPPVIVDADANALGYWTQNTTKTGRFTDSDWVSTLSALCEP